MVIRSNLFSKGHPLKGEPGLTDALERHKRGVLNKIKAIVDLDQMNDPFLEKLVKGSLVDPLVIHFDKATQKVRTETLDASYLPDGSMGARRYGRMGNFTLQGGNQKQVARLTVPFSGEEDLLNYSPNPCGLNFPRGEVRDNTIQFDVVFWGSSDEDRQRVKNEVRQNLDLIATHAAAINKQAKEFNESLPSQVGAAFAAKLDELAKQFAVFDELGIPEGDEPPPLTSRPTAPPPKRGKARAVQIIQHVGTMYVQQLNQTNNNLGDVNNAIQSD